MPSMPTQPEFGSYAYLRLLAEVMTLTSQARLDALTSNGAVRRPRPGAAGSAVSGTLSP